MTILVGDCRALLRTLDADSVQTCVTSPPYWGLRDYGTATWEGGSEECEHRVGGQVQDSKAPGAILSGQRPGVDASKCRDCGARRIDSQLGLEETPDAYVAAMVEVFREVRRVLRPDGTLWLNLGDSYASGSIGRNEGNGGGSTLTGGGGPRYGEGSKAYAMSEQSRSRATVGLAPKNLVGIPWRVAFALQADGWWLRSDIIWSKPNPMPESVTDRPTKAHEYVFLMSKAESYFYDARAIAEPSVVGAHPVAERESNSRRYLEQSGRNDGGVHRGGFNHSDTRNARSVWPIASEPYDGAHFAVMPSALVSRCILAGSRMGDTVLDPFLGSGTVGMVAEQLGRSWVGCELNPDFAELARKRTAQRGLFVERGVALG